jgi:hypothetical protein
MRFGCRLVGAGMILASVLPFAGLGCSQSTPAGAVGRADDVSVFTNVAPDGAAVRQLQRLFAYPVDVVGTDPAFYLDVVPFRRFRTYRLVKNQIFAVNLGAKDRLARAVPDMLAGKADDLLAAKAPFLRIYRDLWADGQTSLFAVAWSAADLQALLTDCDSTRVRQDFEGSVIAGLTKTMYALGEEKELSAGIARKYGFTLRLVPGFFAAESPQGHTVKLNAADPVRLIIVHWEDGELPLDAATWDPIMAEQLKVYNDGDYVLASHSRSYPGAFQGRPALKWEGIWQNEKYTIGGPFRAYAFHREGKSWLMIGQVFAPGDEKVRILRRVEGYMATFTTVS